MTQQFAVPDDSPPHNPRYSDAFVVFSVTVLSCAIGAWLLLRLGLALWIGSVAALGVYAALLSFHMLVRRSIVCRRAPDRRCSRRRAERTKREPSPAGPEAARWAETVITEPPRPADELPRPNARRSIQFPAVTGTLAALCGGTRPILRRRWRRGSSRRASRRACPTRRSPI